jgi:hypothetical protein
LKAFINSGKGVDEITQDIAQSDLGQRWASIQGQTENTSKLMGSGLYNYQDTSESYLQKAEQAFANRNSDLGMFYQYKALENEINNNPNSIYARDEEGNIFDTVNGITYSAPDTYQIDPNEFKSFQTSLKNTTTGESGISDPVFAIANRKDRVEGTPGMGGQDASGINDPRNSMKITDATSFDDGTSLVTFEDGSTGIIDTESGQIIRGDLGFNASQNPNLYAESAYAQALNKDKLPSWLNTWMDASSQGVQKETGFAASQGLTATAAGTYKDPTGNEYKKVTISGKDYLQDVKNPTGLYAIDGSGTATGGTSGGTTTGTASGTTGGSGTSSGPGATAGTGSGAGAGSGSGTQPGAGGTGTGTGTLAGALSTADYIAKNDVNKDGIVNAADSIAATAALTGLYKQGQRQQVVQKAVQGMRRPIDAEPAKVVQGEQAALANLDTFKPETPPPAAAPNQPTGDLYFDESQVVNDNNFGTNQQASGQQQPGQNLFFDESQIRMAAEGGQIEHNPEFFSEGGLGTLDNRYVRGEGDGTSDSVPAMLASGEFVIPADVVSGLGNGDNDAGAAVLDEFMKAIRAHKRAADPSELPEDSKGPLAYLQEAMEKVRA